MDMLNITDFRKDAAEYVNKVRYSGKRITLKKNNKPACALVSMEDLALLEAIEDRIDLNDAKKALRRGKFVSLDDAMKQLGL